MRRIPLFRVQLLAPLRHPPFRLLFAGQVVSDLGDWLDLLALLTLLAYQWRLGAPALAALTMAQLLPWAVVGPLAGVLVDRWPRRRVMVSCDLTRALIVLGLIWAPNLVDVLVLVALKFVLSTAFNPARWSAVQVTVPEDDLLAANSLSRLSVNATKLLGPVVGGLLVAASGPRSAFIVDSLTFLASAALLSRLPSLRPEAPSGAALDQALLAGFRSGLDCIVQRKALLLAVAAIVLEMLIVESNDSLFVLAAKGLGMGEALVGIAIGCSGAGNVIGAMFIGQWGRHARPFGIMGGGQMIVGVVEASIGVALLTGLRGGGVWLPLLLINGAGFACIWTSFSYILQRETPPELMGRVTATATGLYTAFGLVGPPAGAVLAQRTSVGLVYAVTACALLLLGMVVMLLRTAGTEPRRDPSPAAESG